MAADAAAVTAGAGHVISDVLNFTVDTSNVVPTQTVTITGASDGATWNGSATGAIAAPSRSMTR